jgi:hypothetical protein
VEERIKSPSRPGAKETEEHHTRLGAVGATRSPTDLARNDQRAHAALGEIVLSCQDFAPKSPCLTLAQDDLDVTVGQQRAKATAHVTSPGMCTSQADALHALVR